MAKKKTRRYWVVSPNVRNNEATVGDWRRASVSEQVAFMGWYPNENPLGRRFAGTIKGGVNPNDIILIARRHNHEPEIVGFGIVQGKYLNVENCGIIRMAVGQLLDYAFQGRKIFGDLNLAILLPKKPDSNLEEWLQHLKISLVWRDGNSFLDNANGQFS